MSEVAEVTLAEQTHAAVRRIHAIKARQEAMSVEAKALADELSLLARKTVPDLLASQGVGIWETDGVLKVKLTTKIVGSMSKVEDEDAAVAYLRENGFGGALRTVLSVEFSEAERAIASALAASIEGTIGKEAEVARSVNHMTLAAWARDRIREGLPVELDKIGLTMWREATVSAK